MPSNGTPYQVRRPRQRALKGVVGKRWREGLGAQRWQRVQGRPGQGPVSRRRGVAHLARGGGWLNLNASEGGQTYPFNNRFFFIHSRFRPKQGKGSEQPCNKENHLNAPCTPTAH